MASGKESGLPVGKPPEFRCRELTDNAMSPVPGMARHLRRVNGLRGSGHWADGREWRPFRLAQSRRLDAVQGPVGLD